MAIRLGLNTMKSMMGEQDIFIKLWRRWLKFGKADYTRAYRLLSEDCTRSTGQGNRLRK